MSVLSVQVSNMFKATCYGLMHGDLVSFVWNEEVCCGVVIGIARKDYPDNVCRPFEWIIEIRKDDGSTAVGVFDTKEELDLLEMADKDNPARSRNYPRNRKLMGIRKVTT